MYNELREKQIKVIDKGYFDIRFYKVFAHLLQPMKQKLEILKENLEQEQEMALNSRELDILKHLQNKEDQQPKITDDPSLRINERKYLETRFELLHKIEEEHESENDVLKQSLDQILESLGCQLPKHRLKKEKIKCTLPKGHENKRDALGMINSDQEKIEQFMKAVCVKNDMIIDELIYQIE